MLTAPFRRRLIPALLALGFSVASHAATPAPTNASFYRMKLGGFTVVALSDGTFNLDSDKLLIEDKPGVVKTLLDRAHLPAVVPSSVNAYLIDTGSKRILVDAGADTLLGPGMGKLQDSLHAAGYTPEQIDEVLVTHLHPDHVGGVTHEGHAAFPNATLRVNAQEAAFWQDKSNQRNVDPTTQGAFDDAVAALKPYIASGHLKTFHAGETLEPGVTAVDISGHTAGHTGYRIQSKGQTLMLWGDLLHSAAVQFPDPRVTIHFDSVPARARAARLKAFNEAAQQGYWVAAAHVPFPGIGHLQKAGDGYTWHAIGDASP